MQYRYQSYQRTHSRRQELREATLHRTQHLVCWYAPDPSQNHGIRYLTGFLHLGAGTAAEYVASPSILPPNT